MIHYVQRVGIRPEMTAEYKRNVMLCNSVCLLMVGMPLIFILLVYVSRGSATITPPVLAQPILLSFPIFLNALGFTNLSRILLSGTTSAVILAYSIYNKSLGLDLETSSYVGFRIPMVASSIIPFLLFSFSEKKFMLLSFILSAAFTLGFDGFHALAGLGYSQVGLSDQSYPLTNIRALVGILIVGSCALILKSLFERSERAKEKLIHEQRETNEELKAQLQENISQNENIIAQKELIEKQYGEILIREANLIESRNQLDNANRIIRSQQDMLKQENLNLEQQLVEQNLQLEKTNKDLIQVNADLQQFTYMASHNLRGPVASLLGLLNLVQRENIRPESQDLYDKARATVNKLENAMVDLNNINSIGKTLLHIKEKIYWDELIQQVLEQYADEIQKYGVRISIHVEEAPFVISLRPILYSIVNNLISNAIKFRSPDRIPMIDIRTGFHQNKAELTITDNGLGMDLSRVGDKLFMMYKRFHEHVGGKGLGLFYVKEEMEILGGNVSVSSELNRSTTFKLEFPVMAGADQQVLFRKDFGKIVYNAFTNCIMVQHKRAFTSEEYRELYNNGLAYFQKYNVVNAIGDMRKSNPPKEADQQWLIDQIIATAAKSGLRHVALVAQPAQQQGDMTPYLNAIETYLNTHGVLLKFFQDLEAGLRWLEECNAQRLKKTSA